MITRRRFLASLAAVPALLSSAAHARTTTLRDVRHSLTSERFRLVLEFDRKPASVRDATYAEPHRLVIDIAEGKVDGALPRIANAFVRDLRYGYQDDDRLRIVLDLASPVPYTVRSLPVEGRTGSRLVVDLDISAIARVPRRNSKRMVVVLDPGHGGKDPGAVGRRKTYEKDVVLKISRKLYNLLKAHPNIVPYLTRGDDRFLRLRTRTRLARDKSAQLFVSIHADAARRRSARGASVYALSSRGASSEHAKWLAAKENAADLIGGVELDGVRDPHVKAAVLDMSQDGALDYSLNAGKHILSALGRRGHRLHSDEVERAGFVVLKSPDVPSLLVETGFISNVYEEKQLRSDAYQNRIAKALHKGIVDYYANNPEFS